MKRDTIAYVIEEMILHKAKCKLTLYAAWTRQHRNEHEMRTRGKFLKHDTCVRHACRTRFGHDTTL